MKPFALLVEERSKDPQRCVREMQKFFERYANISSGRKVDLEEVTWCAALILLGLRDIMKTEKTVEETEGGKIVNVVADSSLGANDAIT